jgi:hypothetical protein
MIIHSMIWEMGSKSMAGRETIDGSAVMQTV